MLRWLIVLCCLTLLTGLAAAGVIPTNAVGLARDLFVIYATALGGTVIFALLLG